MAEIYVELPADVWTELAPPGFGQINIQPIGNVSILISMSLSIPPNSLAKGTSYGQTTPVTVGDDADGIYARPAIPGNASGINIEL